MANLSWRHFQAGAFLEDRPGTKTNLTLEADTDLFAIADRNRRHLAWATWFADLFRRFYPDAGPDATVHLRRVHYRLVSSEEPIPMVGSVDQDYAICEFWVVPASGKKKDGQVIGDTRPNTYENNKDCWQALCKAAKWARHLGLISGDLIEDNRSPLAITQAFSAYEAPELDTVIDAGWGYVNGWSDGDDYVPAEVEWDRVISPVASIPDAPSLPCATLSVANWRKPRTHHLEIWVEKSTMNDVLAPICQRHGIVLQTLVGESSLTRTGDLLRRIRANGGIPTRVFYLSDFDPAGKSMPAAASRRVEYLIRDEDPDLDVQVTHLLLTLEQVQEYRLPTTPIKQSESRAETFLARFGVDGAVELDALEALHPGVLEQMVLDAIQPYLDANQRYGEELGEVKDEAQDLLDEANTTVEGSYGPSHRQFEAEWDAAVQAEQANYDKWRTRAIARLRPVLARMRPNCEQALEALLNSLPDLEELPLPEPEVIDEDDPLLDTHRDYLDQLDRYRQHKGINE
jgi:hypothetical protein